MSLPSAFLLFLLIPNEGNDAEEDQQSHKQRLRNLDLVGVTLLTGTYASRAVERLCADKSFAPAALILFIYSVTTATGAGWGTGQVLAPLIISVFMVAGFFIWEAKIPAGRAAVYVSHLLTNTSN